MDGFVLGLFLLAAFLGGFASGLAGFAMGFVVAGIWLHIITPIQTATLIIGYGLWTQGYGVWKLRHALDWRTLAPFIIGGTIGVPLGTMLLTYIDPAYMRSGIGVLLVIYGIYGLTQPALKPVPAGPAADGGVGFLNGMLCGLTGFPGFIITIWCQLRGWSKDVQRAVFQPVMLAADCRDRDIAELHRRRDHGDRQIVCARPAGACWPACGSASSSTASSTMPRSASCSWCCCCARGCR